VAARRWPAFAVVGGVLGAEEGAGDIAAVLPGGPLSSLAWGSSSALAASLGAGLAPRTGRVPLVLGGAHAALSAAMFAHQQAHALTVATFCAYAALVLLMRSATDDAGRVAVGVVLAGNVVAAAFVALVGIDVAYGSDLVLWSNNVVHGSVVGLALWTMRQR
jgi:hypothetical protein